MLNLYQETEITLDCIDLTVFSREYSGIFSKK